MALGCIFLVIHTAHNVQAHLRQPLVQLKEGVDHGLNVLDGRQTHHRANVHPAVIGLEGNVLKAVELDAVGNDLAFVRLTAHIDLRLASVMEQARHAEGAAVDLLGQHVEKANPAVLKRGHHPVGANDLLLALARVDAVLGQQHRRVVNARAQTGKQTAVTGRDSVVHIGHRHLTAQQVQHGQQHRAHGVEGIGKRNVGVLGQAHVAEDVHKRATLQKRERMHAAALEDVE